MREMKDSGIEWIGMIPTDWNIVRIGNQYTERKTKVSDRDYPPLSVTMKGILPQLASAAKTDAHDDRKLVCKGDFAINSRSDRRGSCGISAYDGSVSLINTILQPRDEMNPEYYDWLFHSPMFSDEFYKWGHGIVDDLWTTNWQDMKRIAIPEPPLDEQQRIADYLSRLCAEIDSVIAKTNAVIEHYRKLKQAIITETVTKGIRGTRSLKDSGCLWLGDIPAEWEVLRLKTIATTFSKGNGITKEDIVVDGDSPCVRYGEIYTKYNQAFTTCVTRTNKEKVSAPKYFSYGDILFTCTGELVEEIGKSIVYLGEEECLAGGDIIILRHDQYPAFLNYALNSNYAQSQKSCGRTKLKVVHISAADIGNITIALPSIAEQMEIAEFLDQKCAMIDAVIAKKIALLGELGAYRKSIIYEYVTGKKEVGAAEQSVTTAIVYPYFPAVLGTKKARFAQAVLMSRILDKCRTKMGRVKLEKMLYTIETSIGFDFDTEYVRQAAGPLDESIYDCEGIISRKNKWYTMKTSKYGVSYTPAKDNGKYKKYYDKYFADYDSEIERIIGIFMDYDADQAEIVATLFAAWNDFIIDRKEFTDEQLVDEVLNNWNDSKKRFSRDVWLRAIQQMRQNNIVPKGYGKRTVIKN